MKKIVVISILTMLGVGLTSQMRPIYVESSPLTMVHAVQIPKQLDASASASNEITGTFKAAVKAAPVASGGDIEGIVRQAARKYGLDEDHFVQVARCESGLTPSSVNHNYYAGGGNPSGLFQFLPETWNRMSSQSGVGGDVFNATANANVAAWAWSNGHSGEWECR